MTSHDRHSSLRTIWIKTYIYFQESRSLCSFLKSQKIHFFTKIQKTNEQKQQLMKCLRGETPAALVVGRGIFLSDQHVPACSLILHITENIQVGQVLSRKSMNIKPNQSYRLTHILASGALGIFQRCDGPIHMDTMFGPWRKISASKRRLSDLF